MNCRCRKIFTLIHHQIVIEQKLTVFSFSIPIQYTKFRKQTKNYLFDSAVFARVKPETH